jgi:hypothetical protein
MQVGLSIVTISVPHPGPEDQHYSELRIAVDVC